jgi:hypothetical protein
LADFSATFHKNGRNQLKTLIVAEKSLDFSATVPDGSFIENLKQKKKRNDRSPPAVPMCRGEKCTAFQPGQL